MTLNNRIAISNIFHLSKVQPVVKYIFMFSLILNMRSVFVHSPNTGFVKSLVILLMGVCVAVGILCKSKIYYSFFYQGIVSVAFIFVFMVLFYVFHQEKNTMLLKIILEMITVALYVFMVEKSMKETMKKFTNLMVIIALVSLIFWLLGSQLHLISPYCKWELDWGDSIGMENGYINCYYGVYFETQTINFFGTWIIRNSAIFAEAPMCSIMFSLAFISELFLNDKPKKKQLFILLIATVTTVSTTGILICIAGIFLKYLRNYGLKKSYTVWKVLLQYLIAPIVFIILVFVAYYMVTLKMDTYSGVSRLADLINGVHAWSNKPILGYGVGSEPLIEQYGNYGFSNSIIPLLTQGGLYLTTIYSIPVMFMCINCTLHRKWNIFYFYLLFLLIFTSTIIPFQNLTFYLFISMLKSDKEQSPQFKSRVLSNVSIQSNFE